MFVVAILRMLISKEVGAIFEVWEAAKVPLCVTSIRYASRDLGAEAHNACAFDGIMVRLSHKSMRLQILLPRVKKNSSNGS